MDTTRYCPSCGEECSWEHRFCQHCRAELPSATKGQKDPTPRPAAPQDFAQTVMGLPIGTILANRYRILGILGHGGMGSVYLAEDQKLETRVAIKVLREVLSRDPVSVKRLIAEARHSMMLSHPNVVRVHNFEDGEMVKFLVMEYVDGGTLAARIADQGKLPEEEARRIAIEACLGLEHAHEQKVIHRDIKPGNILLGKSGAVKIADFGIARECRDSVSRLTSQVDSGTLLYMSPEQLIGKSNEASDVYSLGVVLYEMLTGEPPFRSGDIPYQIREVVPEPPDTVSPTMSAIMLKCLEKKPERRLPSVRALRAELEGTAEAKRNEEEVRAAELRRAEEERRKEEIRHAEQMKQQQEAEERRRADEKKRLEEEKTRVWESKREALKQKVTQALEWELLDAARTDLNELDNHLGSARDSDSDFGRLQGMFVNLNAELQRREEEEHRQEEMRQRERHAADERNRRQVAPRTMVSGDRTSPRKRRLVIGLVIAAFVIVVSIIFVLPYLSKAPGTGKLTVDSTPAGAQVYINDEYRGTTPLPYTQLIAGAYRIRVQADGYETMVDTVDIAVAADIRRNYVLNRQASLITPPAAPTTKVPQPAGVQTKDLQPRESEQPKQNITLGTPQSSNSVGMEFVPIPAGKFMMGCSAVRSQCYDNEIPRHEVTISWSFELGKYEVTQGQWVMVMGNNRSDFKGDDRLPVERVTWNNAQAFIAKLTALNDGYRYRLPTEAEWEYAARGGTAGPYYGDLDEIAWYRPNSGGKSHPVGQKQPNGYGLYDMLGNVWEWCSDWYGESYYGGSPAADPKGPASGELKAVRGGAWHSDLSLTRVFNRAANYPSGAGDGSYSVGFRVCREKL